MDVFRRNGSGLDREIQLRILQYDADFHDPGTDRHAAFQTEILVHFLPDGNDDAGDLPDQGRIWKREIIR